MQEGYVKLYRKLTTEAVWSDPLKLRLWLQCLTAMDQLALLNSYLKKRPVIFTT